MSAEVVNGYVQYKFDLGSGPLTLTSDKVVSDGVWHQVIFERCGLSCRVHHLCVDKVCVLSWFNFFVSVLRHGVFEVTFCTMLCTIVHVHGYLMS